MRSYRLWLEPDNTFPQFFRLCCEDIEVPVADVVMKGVHPFQEQEYTTRVMDKFLDLLNDESHEAVNLSRFGYSDEFHWTSSGHAYTGNLSQFQGLLKVVHESIFFVDDSLTYEEVLKIASAQLTKKWSHRMAKRLLHRSHPVFDNMRSFLKAKSDNVKISSYRDFDGYDLGQMLSVDDFKNEETILITEGIPTPQFRSTRFLDAVTDGIGRIRLHEGIRDFQIMALDRARYGDIVITYQCTRHGSQIRFQPELPIMDDKRAFAKRLAEQWRVDDGRYCFTTTVDKLEQMLQDQRYYITFPSLDYVDPEEPDAPEATVLHSKVERYTIGKHVTESASGETIKRFLKQHGRTMTGRKEELLEKLAKLAADLYKKHEREMNAYFGQHRYTRANFETGKDTTQFPLLEDLDLRNLLLTMYALKHLRGNAILESSHDNNTFDLLSLAKALINREVSVKGTFLPVR